MMESLKFQEETLEQQLCTYQTQLSVVTENVSRGNDSEDTVGLLSLQTDLEELTSLTRESLLEVKKQLLLSSIDCSSKEVSNQRDDNHDIEGDDSVSENKVTSANKSGQTVTGSDGSEDDPVIQGMKCRAPFEGEMSWRGVSYHNAMILCEESNDKVRILYTHPRFDSMKPCSFFLEGNCKFSEENCRYSHGHVVAIDQLQPFTDPNFSSLRSGRRCLAKRTDSLWHDAIVRHCGDILTVQFTTSGQDEVEITIEDIIPLSGSDSSSSDCSSSDDSEVVAEKEEEEEGVSAIDWIPLKTLGEWEQYTTGIGSKLLEKMGYVMGKGLGKDDQGRVEPVPIEILPSGKSLDACAAIREEKKLKMGDGEKRKRKKKRKGGASNRKGSSIGQGESSSNKDMFEFLNTKLGQVGKEVAVPKSERVKTALQKSENLNIELFKVQETISNLEKKIKALKSRNKDRKDKRVEEHIEKNITSADNKIQHLKKQERLIMNKMKRKSEETKLSVF